MSAGDGIPVKGLGTAGTPDVGEVVTVQGIGAGGRMSGRAGRLWIRRLNP